MAATRNDLCNELHTRPTVLVAPPGALMLSSAEHLSAWLIALVFLVLRVCGMTYHVTHVTALESRGAWYGAASLWCLFEVFSTRRMDHVFRVVLARQHQCISHISTLSHVVNNSVPQWTLCFQKTDVSNTEKSFLSSGQRHANSVFNLQETDFAFFVASHQ